jgi:flagellar biosynthesis protein FlgN
VSYRDAGHDPAGLADIIEHGIGCMQALKAALLDERDALAQRDAKRLADAVTSKEQLTRKLLVVERHKAELGRLTAQAPASPASAVRGRALELREIARECEQLNQTNGTIIRSRRQHVIDGLSVLRGRDYDEDTYTLSGATATSIGRRSLTEA